MKGYDKRGNKFPLLQEINFLFSNPFLFGASFHFFCQSSTAFIGNKFPVARKPISSSTLSSNYTLQLYWKAAFWLFPNALKPL